MADAKPIATDPFGPSALETGDGSIGREMTKAEIRQVVAEFGDAAARAEEAGYDAIQIHGAHGFLLSQFLSPYFNRRTDEYGGSVENRSRILVEVVESVRNATGEGFPILVKINTEDKLEGGNGIEETLQIARMLERHHYYRDAATKCKAVVSTPLILVGGIRSLRESEDLVASGVADYISFSRPLIREPDLIRRWESGDEGDAECISDNLCVVSQMEGNGLRCVHVAEA